MLPCSAGLNSLLLLLSLLLLEEEQKVRERVRSKVRQYKAGETDYLEFTIEEGNLFTKENKDETLMIEGYII